MAAAFLLAIRHATAYRIASSIAKSDGIAIAPQLRSRIDRDIFHRFVVGSEVVRYS